MRLTCRRRLPALLLLLAVLALLAACTRTPPAAGDGDDAAAARADTPTHAILRLRDRLLAHDAPGFARAALPPALHAQVAAAWRDGRSRWPLDELPLDAKLPALLAALQAPGAETALLAGFRRQFAGADRDIDQAVRTLVVFAGEYVQAQADTPPHEREHTLQVLAALGEWALAAPLSDPSRARRTLDALAAAARRSGIPAARGQAAFAALGMQASLQRLSPFLATLLAQLRTQYGLDLDASLRGLRVQLLEQTGDQARVRLRYPLGPREIDAVVPMVRIDGAWYVADYVRRARASLEGAGGGGRAASP